MVINETKKGGGLIGEMEIRASEEPCITVTLLRRTNDESFSFEIVEASIKRAHRLERTTGQQLASSEDGCVWAIGVDSTSEGGEQSARA
jgi:hypothetical protein